MHSAPRSLVSLMRTSALGGRLSHAAATPGCVAAPSLLPPRLAVASRTLCCRATCSGGSSPQPQPPKKNPRRRTIPNVEGVSVPQAKAPANLDPHFSNFLGTEMGADHQPPPIEEQADSVRAAMQGQPFCVVNFYHLSNVEDPEAAVARHKAWVADNDIDITGRIYISAQGVNAQCSLPVDDAIKFIAYMEALPEFKGLRYRAYPVESHSFPRLRLQVKPNLISLAGGMDALPVTDEKARSTPLAPAQWKEMLATAQDVNSKYRAGETKEQIVVLDVRNAYEWDAGHFAESERPEEDMFNQTPVLAAESDDEDEDPAPEEIPAYLRGVEPDTPVMMYCTGGIRCDIYSTVLRKAGFNNLYSLEGGVHNYLDHEGGDRWNGSLFVFDGRMAVKSGNVNETGDLPAAVPCQHCGGPAAVPHVNCANIDCNKLFISCAACKERMKGTCCDACLNAPRMLRPLEPTGAGGNQYGKWIDYAIVEEGKEAIRAGRGLGRSYRRKRHAAKRREKMLAKREKLLAQREERRQMFKSKLEEQTDTETDHVSTNEAAAERRARIEELRKKRAAVS